MLSELINNSKEYLSCGCLSQAYRSYTDRNDAAAALHVATSQTTLATFRVVFINKYREIKYDLYKGTI